MTDARRHSWQQAIDALEERIALGHEELRFLAQLANRLNSADIEVFAVANDDCLQLFADENRSRTDAASIVIMPDRDLPYFHLLCPKGTDGVSETWWCEGEQEAVEAIKALLPKLSA
jgi:hypothetical protein